MPQGSYKRMTCRRQHKQTGEEGSRLQPAQHLSQMLSCAPAAAQARNPLPSSENSAARSAWCVVQLLPPSSPSYKSTAMHQSSKAQPILPQGSLPSDRPALTRGPINRTAINQFSRAQPIPPEGSLPSDRPALTRGPINRHAINQVSRAQPILPEGSLLSERPALTRGPIDTFFTATSSRTGS